MAGPILKKLPVAAASLAPAWVSTASASGANADYGNIRFHRETIDGVGIHYEEAGDPGRPTLVLLHGFPSTSRMWDRLIPTLATEYHVIARDYPGFGLCDAPSPKVFDYTFDHLADVMPALLERIHVRLSARRISRRGSNAHDALSSRAPGRLTERGLNPVRPTGSGAASPLPLASGVAWPTSWGDDGSGSHAPSELPRCLRHASRRPRRCRILRAERRRATRCSSPRSTWRRSPGNSPPTVAFRCRARSP